MEKEKVWSCIKINHLVIVGENTQHINNFPGVQRNAADAKDHITIFVVF